MSTNKMFINQDKEDIIDSEDWEQLRKEEMQAEADEIVKDEYNRLSDEDINNLSD